MILPRTVGCILESCFFSLVPGTILQTFCAFRDLDTFEEYRKCVFSECPSVGFEVSRLHVWGRNTAEVIGCPSHCIRSGSACQFVPLLVRLSLVSHLVKMESASFLDYATLLSSV